MIREGNTQKDQSSEMSRTEPYSTLTQEAGKAWRNILVITLGGAPGIVTETVWALIERDPPWVPDEIYLVTTSFGARDWRDEASPANRQLAAIFAVKHIVPVKPHVVVPIDKKTRAEVSDIRTEAENIAFADALTRLVKEQTDRDDTRLHVSMAGGRKTMSSYSQAAVSLFGRDRDELSHVLVHPPALENSPEFFWPGQEQTEIDVSKRPPPPPKKIVRANEAEIALVQSPFVRLRALLPPEGAFPGGEIDHWKIIEQVQLGLERNQIRVICAENRLQVGVTGSVKLPPQAFAFYRLLATALKEGWPGAGPDGVGPGHKGWLTYWDFYRETSQPRDELFKFYEESAAVADQEANDPFQRMKENFESFRTDLMSCVRNGDCKAVAQAIKGAKHDLKGPIANQIPNLQKRILAQVFEMQSKATINGMALPKVGRFGLNLQPRQIEIVPP